MAIVVRRVGHVVLKVRDLERAARFYRDVLGLKEVARANFGRPMAFFSTGENHHDVAVMEVGRDAPAPEPQGVGLYHVALRIGNTLDELRAATAHLEAHGYTSLRLTDHRVSQSIYLDDPDGNGVELYWDRPEEQWPRRPGGQGVAMVTEPLDLRGLLAELDS